MGTDKSLSWQEQLAALASDLPAGEETAPTPAEVSKPAKRCKLVITYEKKGRGGKQATIISGFDEQISDDEIAGLASEMKKKLGVGGSARGGEILIQGDRRTDVATFLRTKGYKI